VSIICRAKQRTPPSVLKVISWSSAVVRNTSVSTKSVCFAIHVTEVLTVEKSPPRYLDSVLSLYVWRYDKRFQTRLQWESKGAVEILLRTLMTLPTCAFMIHLQRFPTHLHRAIRLIHKAPKTHIGSTAVVRSVERTWGVRTVARGAVCEWPHTH
jgi:hypothetical protein